MLRVFDEDVLWVIRQLRPYFARIEKRNKKLAEQGRDALASVGLNAEEADGNRKGRQRSQFEIAIGSMKETRATIRVAEAFGYIDMPPFAVMDRIEKIIATLLKLSR
jgi:four helix bundle protein